MPTFKRPGTYVEEVLVSQTSGFGTNATTVAAFTSHNPRGPVEPTFVSSWTDYVSRFGAFQGDSLLPFALFSFFGNGGRGAYVTRVAGTGAVVATRTLKDRAPAVATAAQVRGTAAAVNITANGNLVLKIDAEADVTVALLAADTPSAVVTKINTALGATGTASLDVGVLVITSATTGTSSRVEIRATSTAGILTNLALVSGEVDLGEAAIARDTLKVDAANAGVWANSIFIDIVDSGASSSGRFDLVVKYNGVTASNIVERWTDLSMTSTDRRYAPALINSLVSGSRYINVTDSGSSTVGNDRNPLVQLGTALVGGADGSNNQHDIALAVAQLDTIDSPVVLNCPGLVDSTEVNIVLAYAEARGDVFVVLDTESGQTAAQALTYANTLTASSYGALYFPHLLVNDPSTPTPGVTKLIPPGGAVVGHFAQNDAARGVWKAPAGVGARLLGSIALERKLTNAELDTLNSASAPVNAIRNLVGQGVCIMGARTLKAGQADKYVPIRRTLIHLKRALQDLTLFAVFEPNDEVLWGQIRSILEQYLTGFWQEGGLRGDRPDQAFYVKCDAAINTPQAIQAGEVQIEVGVSLEYPAEFVVIKIGQSNGGASVVETQ